MALHSAYPIKLKIYERLNASEPDDFHTADVTSTAGDRKFSLVIN